MNQHLGSDAAALRLALVVGLLAAFLQTLAVPLFLRHHAQWTRTQTQARCELLGHQLAEVAREAYIPEPDPFLLSYLAEKTLQEDRVLGVSLLDERGRALVSLTRPGPAGLPERLVLEDPILAQGRKVGAVRLDFLAAPDLAAARNSERQIFQAGLIVIVAGLALSLCGLPVFRRWVERFARGLETALSRHVSRDAVEDIMSRPEVLGCRDRQVTLLLCDIRNFTAFSENLPSAAVFLFLNEFFGRVVRIIHKHDGSVDKYMGDAVLAVFGAPTADSAHATAAVMCALEIRSAIRAYNREREGIGQPPIRIGIALNTGTAAIGSIGTEERAEYTIIGDAVNVVSRMEGLNKELGTDIVLSKATRESIWKGFPCRPLGAHKLRGRLQEVELYEALEDAPGGPEEVTLHDRR